MEYKRDKSLVDDIKDNLSISAVLKHYGCVENGSGENWECTRHNSANKKSLVVHESDGVCWCCAPSCDLKGDIFSIIGLYEGLDPHSSEFITHIIPKACEMAGIDIQTYSSKSKEELMKEHQRVVTIKKAHHLFYSLCVPFLKQIVPYILDKRKISAEQLSKLNLGYLPPDEWPAIRDLLISRVPGIQDIIFEDKDGKTKQLINTYTAFKGRIIHPHFLKEDILYFTGESTPNTTYNAESKYVKMNHNFSVFGRAEGYLLDSLFSENHKNIIFAEGYWDALKLHLFGFPVVSFGTCKVSKNFIQRYAYRLKSFDQVITCFDSEENQSGLEGAIALNSELLKKGVCDLYISNLPILNEKKVDIDEFINHFESEKEKIEAVNKFIVKDSKLFYEYLTNRTSEFKNSDEIYNYVKGLIAIARIYNAITRNKIFKNIRSNFDITQKVIDEILKEVVAEDKEAKKAKRTLEESPKLDDRFSDDFTEGIQSFVDKLDLAEKFYKSNPFFYDENKIWWLWSKETKSWNMVDETDLMIAIDACLTIAYNTTVGNVKNEILEAMRRTGRKHKPEDVKETWVQFKGEIVDVTTGEVFESTPEYFSTNPIMWSLGDSEDTPAMDRIFEEWVGAEVRPFLYEVIAYSLLPSYPLHRIFCLTGSGSNGKSKFLSLLNILVGKKNCCASSLDLLMNSRFESAKLYRKLVCMMGETNFVSLKRTDLLKKLSGGDMVNFEFKNKTPFEDLNYATLLIATNSLPITNDKTIGFYRRWNIVDFPNQFSEKKDILAEIPEWEYENLARKCVKLLKTILIERKFTGEGSVEDRRTKYEDLSNPVMKFIKERIIREVDQHVSYREFEEELTLYFEEKGHRVMNATEIGRILTSSGFARKNGSITKPDGSKSTARQILDMRWKTSEELKFDIKEPEIENPLDAADKCLARCNKDEEGFVPECDLIIELTNSKFQEPEEIIKHKLSDGVWYSPRTDKIWFWGKE